MKNIAISAAYLEGAKCADLLLEDTAEQYIASMDLFEEDEAAIQNDNLLRYIKAIGFLSCEMGLPFLRILPEFFRSMDIDVPKSIKKVSKTGSTELMQGFLFGFGLEIQDAILDWEEYLLENEYIMYDEEADDIKLCDIDFDPEKVQRGVFNLNGVSE